MRNERGIALVMALLVCALLVAAVTEFIHEVFVETSLHRSRKEGEQAILLAESGVVAAESYIRRQLADPQRRNTSLLDPWLAGPIPLEAERGSIEVRVEEETGKIPLGALVRPNGNYREPVREMTERLLEGLELPKEIVPAVADWSDENDEARPGGAEAPYYLGLQPQYRPANAQMETLDELTLVKGVTPEMVEKLRPFVTVYSDGLSDMPTVNVNTAPLEVLASLKDVTKTLAQQIVDYRKTTPFKAPGEIVRVSGMERIGMGLQGKVSVKGNVFRIRSTGKSGTTPKTVEAVVRIAGTGSPHYLYWREF